MKQYIKPMADVVELAVRENIAKLPNALTQGRVGETKIQNHTVTLTTYNLASLQDSNDVANS